MTYEWTSKEYSYYDMPLFINSTKEQWIVIEYQDMKVEVHDEVSMVDFNTFVSNVGGALGLFLGFSIIDTLLYIYSKFLCKN